MKRQHILIVEDEEILRNLIAKELIKHDYIVTVAPDGAAGLSIADEGVSLSLILLDLLMPNMDGYEFLQEIRRRDAYRTVPIIVMSNSGQVDDLNRAYTLGANAVLIKADFNPDQLVHKVNEQLRGEESAPGAAV